MTRVSPAVALFWSLVGLTCIFLVLPSLIVIPMSFNPDELMQFPPHGFSLTWYKAYFAEPNWRAATINSFLIGGMTALLATALGTLTAYGLVRGRVPLRNLVIVVMLLPMIVPTIVTGFALYGVFAPLGLVGTTAGFILAHTVLAFPFALINVTAAMQRMDWRAEQAARSLGASALSAFVLVTLPMIRPGILAGAVFAFMTSFDEVVVSRFMSGTVKVTLPIMMWTGLRFEINPIVAAASTVLIVLSVAVLASAGFVRRKA